MSAASVTGLRVYYRLPNRISPIADAPSRATLLQEEGL